MFFYFPGFSAPPWDLTHHCVHVSTCSREKGEKRPTSLPHSWVWHKGKGDPGLSALRSTRFFHKSVEEPDDARARAVIIKHTGAADLCGDPVWTQQGAKAARESSTVADSPTLAVSPVLLPGSSLSRLISYPYSTNNSKHIYFWKPPKSFW